ncbi:MAG TPA: acetylglutamate kinase [Candidatus Deferrimicrobium sp.]|nr:acetylglutamate kinase [Candidatus Deferrimicrobium sp.]
MVLTALEKAKILIEALPYIKNFSGKTVVIKYGGNAMLDEELKKAVLTDITLMKFVGINPVVVHGGGPEINSMLKKVGKSSSFVQGLRVTDQETMEITEMVLSGKLNKEIVGLLASLGAKAVGISGKDAQLLLAEKKPMTIRDELGMEQEIDLGFVGEVTEVNTEIIETLVAKNFIPVIAPVAAGAEGESYNINADYVAGHIAGALKADKLVLLTDVEGIFADYSDKTTLLSEIKAGDVEGMIEQGIIKGGMIPKIQCCVQAIAGGVGKVHIIDGRLPHAILLEIFTDEGIGTMVTA